MSIKRLCALALAGTMLACVATAESISTVTVDPSRLSEVGDGLFEGWGTSLCWWANRIGYSDKLAELAAEAFCNPETGLGLNILRYNIGGGDDPTHDHITRTDSMIPGFWANPVYNESEGTYTWDWDWSQDARQRNVLEKCIAAYGPGILVEGFSNSPPYFMTKSGCSSGAKMAFQNNLRDDAYEAFARYLAEVAAHFDEAFGIRFQSLSPMNEPNTSYWGAMSPKQEGCHFDPGLSQSRILTALSEKLAEKGLSDIQIAGTDETSIDTQALSLSQLSEEALSAISRVDTHSYAGSGREFLRSQTLLRGKNLWMSEVDGGDTLGKDAGEMGAGLWLARRIMEDLNGLTPSAWVLWQVIDSHISQEGYLGRTDTGMVDLNGGYWGVSVMDHDAQQLLLTQKYYVFGQFTRHIRPGMQLIAMQGDAVCARDPKTGALVIVLMNADSDEKTVRIDTSALGTAIPASTPVHVTRTSGSLIGGEHWATLASLATDASGFTAQLLPYSVTTYTIAP
ncbi:MAG: hypothetical protein IJ708_06730 [Clostridia bacterium]|nr:hypothetical protein [Clostridia bacterium]